jgi:aldehyde:ferredoxin oxidoreductase
MKNRYNTYGGYSGRLLRVDLSRGSIEQEETARYLPDWIGGRGIAIRIAWEEIRPGMGAFDPTAPLMIITGPLTGTAAPFSGRTTVCGLAPQGYPHEWYTHSSFGGHWGAELKYAGFDGIIVKGRCNARPVYLSVENGKASLEDASALRGRGIIEKQKLLFSRLGKGWRIFAIGPAGENLSRIAVAATETESASGQGGFGAVMGAKGLMAIAVRGQGSLSIAHSERFNEVCTLIREEVHGSHGWPHTPRLDPEKVRLYGQRFQACTQGCSLRCYDARSYRRVPGVLCKGRNYSGQVDCVAQLFTGAPSTFYDWKLGFRAGFEIGHMSNDMGLNHWELLIGMIPWLRALAARGEMKKIDDLKIDVDRPEFWVNLLEKIAHRRGLGDVLAEGTVRASHTLGTGLDICAELYPAWGYAGHWDGHGDRINKVFFPYWVVSALQWALDTRDPISSSHGYAQNIMGWSPYCSPHHGLSWERIVEVAARVYGTPDAAHPASGYKAKHIPALWHTVRSVMKDSLPVGDQVFPRIYSRRTPDNFARAGDMEGPSFEYHLFKACTGIQWPEAQFARACERILQLERAFLVRNFHRSRNDDEALIPYFERPENLINPFVGSKMGMDASEFRRLLGEVYRGRGWNVATGRPSRETLEKFGCGFAAADLAEKGLLP